MHTAQLMAANNQYMKKYNPIRFRQGRVTFGIIDYMDFVHCVMLKIIINTHNIWAELHSQSPG
jgi:hypothetical protein